MQEVLLNASRRNLCRGFSTKVWKQRKSVLLQDEEKIPVAKYRASGAKDHRLYVWGLSETGALGVSKSLWQHKQKYTAFIQHPTRHSFSTSHEVLDIACGYGFSLFLTKEDKGIQVFGTGINTDCQVGFHKHGGATNRPMELMIYPAPIELPKKSPEEKLKIKSIAAGRAHSILITDDGEIFSMGNNSYGQLGREIVEGEDYMRSHIVHRFTLPNELVASVCCGQDHTMFLTESGRVYTCGWGADGQTGNGTYETSGTINQAKGDIAGEKIVKLACSADCVLALSDKGEVFGWGNTEYGQLCNVGGNAQQIHTPHGDVFVWGYGVLGLGPTAECILTPQQIPSTLFGRNEFSKDSVVTSIYSGISHMGAINSDGDLFMLMIYPAPIELPKKSPEEKLKVKSIAAGRAHTILITDGGEIFSMGNNSYGQLGREIVEGEDYMRSHIVHRFTLPNELVASVCCGQDHTMFLTESGRVYTCGWGADGQTGNGTYETSGTINQAKGDIAGEKIVKLACSADCVLALSDKGEVFGWGNTEYGQLCNVGGNAQQIHTPVHLKSLKGLGKITDIASGGSFCLILNEHGDVFVWGYGVLGLGPTAECILTPQQIPSTLFGRNEFSKDSVVTSIYSGISHMGAINSDGDLFMWGINKHGCLGLGHRKDMYFPFKVAMGAKVIKISCGVDHTLALCRAFV
uniref:RCC1-like domain-containing protein n=1 Tax=Lutzomyia longipalpis TaxID=7200 RepID=A0A1B0GKG8_LUTLO